MEKKLNLGCENLIFPGWLNLDKIKRPGVDIVHDLDKFPYPFKNNEISEVFMSHVLEYLNEPIKSLLELHRICKDKAKVIIIVPHYTISSTYAELGHKRPGLSYLAFGEKHWNKELNDKYKVIKKRLVFTRVNYPWLNYIFNPIINLNPLLYERFFAWILPCSEVHFVLEIVK